MFLANISDYYFQPCRERGNEKDLGINFRANERGKGKK